jgi:RecA-family ATPase
MTNLQRGYTPNELISWTPPKIDWVIKYLLAPQNKMLIYGQSETMKSWLTYHLGFQAANGKPFLGFKTSINPTLIVQSEIPQPMVRDRLINYMSGNKITTNLMWIYTDLYIKLDKPWGISPVEAELRRTLAKILIIDPMFNTFSGKLTDDYEVRLYQDRINMLIKDFGCSVVIVHHMRKPQIVDGIQLAQTDTDIFGTSMWKNWFDSMLQVDLIEATTEKTELNVKVTKSRHSPVLLPNPVALSINRRTLEFTVNNINEGCSGTT